MMRDPKFYLENFCHIKTKEGGFSKFFLNEAQKDMLNALRTHDRIVVRKARQLGMSTLMAGYIYHATIFTPGVVSALIAHDRTLAIELLDKVKTFYRTTPDAIKPKVLYNSKSEISFPNIDSKIVVLTGDKVGRGWTLKYVLASEFAFWENAEDKLSILEASAEKGKIVIESTPAGLGNKYHQVFSAEDNGYLKKDYGWWWGYSRESIDTIERRINDPRRFAREYLLEFESSGRPVFDLKLVQRMRSGCVDAGGEVKSKDGIVSFARKDDDGLVVYRDPVPGRTYVLGADPSEGITGGDYAGVVILDRKSGEEVAMFRGLVAPDLLGSLIDKWGRKYNNALVVVEVNNHGLTTLTILKQKLYPSLYYRPAEYETTSSSWSDKLGWKTTKLTRPLMIDDLVAFVREGQLSIRSKAIIDEMTVFAYNKAGKPEAMEGWHDDMVLALAICLQGFKVICAETPTQLDYRNVKLGLGFGV